MHNIHGRDNKPAPLRSTCPPHYDQSLPCIYFCRQPTHSRIAQSQCSRNNHASLRSMLPRIVSNCFVPCLMACSVRPLVMPHSATSSARGDDISTTSI